MFMGYITTFEIRPDNRHSGIDFMDFEEVKVLDSEKYLAYRFNISSMENILTSYTFLKNICKHNDTLNKIFQNEVEHNILWDKNNLEPEFDKSDILEINNPFLYDSVLNSKINLFNFEKNMLATCKNFEVLVHYFLIMNQGLNELSKLNKTTIVEVINEFNIIQDMTNLLVSQVSDKEFLPFVMTEKLPANFYDFVKVNYYYDKYQVSIIFSIPFYRNVMLLEVFPKPFIARYSPYILNTEMKYAFILGNESFFYTKSQLNESCFENMGNKYCTKIYNQAYCEKNLVANVESEIECFTRLPRKNMITQIGDTIFFTVFKPMIVQFNCFNGQYLVQMTSHSKLTNNFDCTINTTDFHYIPNSLKKYDIHVMNHTNSTNSYWESEEFYSFLEDASKVFAILGFVITFYEIYSCIMCCRPKMKSYWSRLRYRESRKSTIL